MEADVQTLLKLVRSLPPYKQVELMQGLAQSLAQVFSTLTQASAAFWAHRSLEEIARDQNARIRLAR